jgi:acyl-CoA dehydrogenase
MYAAAFERALRFAPTPRSREFGARLARFMLDVVVPGESEYWAEHAGAATRWTIPSAMEEMKAEARAQGLWNLFLPDATHGAGLAVEEYAPLAEIMGHSLIAPEVFNCSAPDTGNMELLHLYASEEQKSRWLAPLLRGEIRSAFAMTEPDVASSDATTIATRFDREGERICINGRKWWTTGAPDPRCAFLIVMGLSLPDAERHARHSMIIVPMDTPGVRIVRTLDVFGYDDAPHGHAEIAFEDARVPVSNLIQAEGRGFEMAQGRLGPGRIHHCMRLIGLAERALHAMCERARSRIAFGKPLAAQGMVQDAIARSRCEIDQARLLTLEAARALGQGGARAARDLIGMIKIVAPTMAEGVIDRAIQIHGGAGVCQDHFLAHAFAAARCLRIADGPDEVHISALAKLELGSHGARSQA